MVSAAGGKKPPKKTERAEKALPTNKANKADKAGRIEVERLGGFGGFGLAGSRVRSCGAVPSSALSPAEQRAVDALFCDGPAPAQRARPDAFRYRLTRQGPAGIQTVEVPEPEVPEALRACVKDELI